MADIEEILERRAQRDLAQLLECGEVTVLFHEPDLRIGRMVEATKRLLGLDQRKLPRTLGDLADRVQCPALLEDARQVLETGETVLRNLKLPQHETHSGLRFYPGRSVAGEFDGLLLSITDNTERWKVTSVVRHLAAIVEYSDDAILSKDLTWIITSWNRGAERLFGYTSTETIGKPVTLLIPEGMPDEEPGILESIQRRQAINHYHTIRRREVGSLADVSLSGSPVRDSDGRVVGASKIAHDVTLEKHAQSQRKVLINEFNHRVKNTLATVQSIAYQPLRHATSTDAFVEAFIARLLALSKPQGLLTNGKWISAPLHDQVLSELAHYRNDANTAGRCRDDKEGAAGLARAGCRRRAAWSRREDRLRDGGEQQWTSLPACERSRSKRQFEIHSLCQEYVIDRLPCARANFFRWRGKNRRATHGASHSHNEGEHECPQIL